MAHDTRATGVGTGAGTVNMNMSGNSSLTVTAASQDNPGTSRDGKMGGQHTPKKGYEKLPNTEDTYICPGKPFRERATVYPGYKILGTGEELKVAIKVILGCTDDNREEVKHLTNLAGYPNVVQIIDVPPIKEDDIFKTMYIVMEMCSESLQSFLDDKLSKGDPLDLKEAMSFARQLVKGIKCIHSEGIIHGDIKPENILISRRGRCIKVSDFGISKVLHGGRSSTKPNGGIGTNGYRAPETYKHNKISKKSDMYSLALTLASIFSHGKHLHGEDVNKAAVRIMDNVDPDYSVLMVKGSKREQFKSLLGRMLSFRKSERITIEDVEQDPFWIETSPSLDRVSFGPVHPASETNPPDQQKTTEEVISEEPSRTPYILSATSDAMSTVCGDPPTNNDAETHVNAPKRRKVSDATSTVCSDPPTNNDAETHANAPKRRKVAENKAVENPSRMLDVPQAGSGATNLIPTNLPINFATTESLNPPDQPKLTKEPASLDILQGAFGAVTQDFSASPLPATTEARQISSCGGATTSTLPSQIHTALSSVPQPCFIGSNSPVEWDSSNSNPSWRPGFEVTEFLFKPSFIIMDQRHYLYLNVVFIVYILICILISQICAAEERMLRVKNRFYSPYLDAMTRRRSELLRLMDFLFSPPRCTLVGQQRFTLQNTEPGPLTL